MSRSFTSVRRLVPAALAAGLCLGGLVACSGSGEEAHGAHVPVSARPSASHPLIGEALDITGSSKKANASVVLQRREGSSWKNVEKTRASETGRFSFTVTALRSPQAFRVVLPASDDGDRPLGRTGPIPIRGVAATAELHVVQAPVGRSSTSPDAVVAQAGFRPQQPGAQVRIEMRRSGGWVTVARGHQDRTGGYQTSLTPDVLPTGATVRAVTEQPGGRGELMSQPSGVSRWREVFADDFSGDQLDADKWRTRVQQPNGRRLCSVPDGKRVVVEDGHAVLSVKRVGKPTGSCPYGFFHNAMIGTSVQDFPGFSATHGIFAARVKFQSGRGQHGSFWLQSMPGTSDTGAEIDVAEYFGDGRADGGLSNYVHHTAADDTLTSSGGLRTNTKDILGARSTPGSSWHVYSVEWTPAGYVFRLDGVPTLTTSKPYVARTPEFMVLSLLTSDWELPALTSTRSVMKVDWVRAWQE